MNVVHYRRGKKKKTDLPATEVTDCTSHLYVGAVFVVEAVVLRRSANRIHFLRLEPEEPDFWIVLAAGKGEFNEISPDSITAVLCSFISARLPRW